MVALKFKMMSKGIKLALSYTYLVGVALTVVFSNEYV